jgi:hypothetical protein
MEVIMEGSNQQVNSLDAPSMPFEQPALAPLGALVAGNTTANLQPSFGPRSSEVIHSTTIGNKPEPTPAETEQLVQKERATKLEAATLPNPSVAAVESSAAYAASIVSGANGDLKAEVADLKQQINDSFSEVANLLLDLATRFDLLDERINRYNAKSSHKI